MQRLIVSTVGTSILTNVAKQKTDKNLDILLRQTANETEKTISKQDRAQVDKISEEVEAKLLNSEFADVKSLSAELNGLFNFYIKEKLLPIKSMASNDVHYLITTDTYQGKKAGCLLEKYLKSFGIKNVQVISPTGLSTKDHKSFENGIKELLERFDEQLSSYKESGYKIVFNLVGGFKILQGYMNIIGMFYADEIIYIFEDASAELIKIPRLPLVIDHIPLFNDKAALFLLMEHSYVASDDEVKDIPEMYLDSDGQGGHMLSNWGNLIWKQKKREIISGELLHFDNIVYEDSFKRDYQSIRDDAMKADIQSTVANVSLLYDKGDLAKLRSNTGLLYEDYVNTKASKIGHFRLNRDWRVSCVSKDNRLILRHVGNHDYVNDNP
jgi:putative CRISPR-associated protein (TIGR02619 family)